MDNNSQRKKQEVEDDRRNFNFSNNKTSVTACNDSLNAKTSNVNFVCVTCGKLRNDNHGMCVLHYINGVNSRTKQSIVVPISTREPKRTVNQSIATPLERTVALESTSQKPRRKIRKQYEQISTTCKWWCSKITPPGYKWKPETSTLVKIILFIVDFGCSKHMTRNLKLLSNFVEQFMGTVKFGNDQITLILGYEDLVQGNSTCYLHDLKGNDLLTGVLIPFIVLSLVMSTSAHFDSKIISYTVGAQSSQVPTSLPDDPYVAVRFNLSLEDTKGESLEPDSKRKGSKDECLDSKEEEEVAPEGQQQVVQVVDTAVDEPLGLGYRAARRHALESTDEIAPSTFEVR
uniref:Retrovirus-related Pol polyprotein from transposon TNT 1-94-like beta-barrel domain-containing protein n=1 Tax=Tanacetum cinerariifolium TaxID=118510 RepID=A0A6L2P2T1_TANCI|nr:hypothetical protein [Tanacetum cinerariifolium]